MPEESQIYVTCSTHPQLTRPKPFTVSHRHRYSPPAIEAEIIKEPEKSSKCLERRLKRVCLHSDFKKHVWKFVQERKKFLMALKKVPEIKSFENYILGLEADVETELQMRVEEKLVEKILEGEVEETSGEKEGKIEEKPKKVKKEYDNILDAVSDAIRNEKKKRKATLQNHVANYVKSFLSLIEWLIKQRLQIKKLEISAVTFRQLIAELLTMDVIYISNVKDQLGTEKSIAVPLDISPWRIALAQLFAQDAVNTNIKNWNRMFYPPIIILWKTDILHLAKPYRTLDKHPIMIRAPSFNKIPEGFLEEVVRTLRDFEESTDPLIRRIKGLTSTGKRRARPAFVTKNLSKFFSYYIDCNPLSIENLRIIDLGCGNGALLRDICLRLLDERKDLRPRIFMQIILNDLTGNPGRSLREDSQREDLANKLELYIWEGDLRRLIDEVSRKGENFDIALINRVFDIYGGYGIFKFDKKDLKKDSSSYPTVATEEAVPFELDNKLITFSGLRNYTELWRAIGFLQNQAVEVGQDVVFLPAVEMNTFKNFFTWKNRDGLDLFKSLLNTAQLTLISVFPGSFETLFPLGKSDEKEIFHCEITESNTYSLICVSKSSSLIDGLRQKIKDFK